jgi:hypothetical protein
MSAILTRRDILRAPTRRARLRFAANTALITIVTMAGIGLLLAYMATLYG